MANIFFMLYINYYLAWSAFPMATQPKVYNFFALIKIIKFSPPQKRHKIEEGGVNEKRKVFLPCRAC